MSQRIHLGTENRPEGTLWFTLVVENPRDFYVELYNDSRQPFVRDRLQVFRVNQFDKFQINGVPLTKLVAEKFHELNFQSPEPPPKSPPPPTANIE